MNHSLWSFQKIGSVNRMVYPSPFPNHGDSEMCRSAWADSTRRHTLDRLAVLYSVPADDAKRAPTICQSSDMLNVNATIAPLAATSPPRPATASGAIVALTFNMRSEEHTSE